MYLVKVYHKSRLLFYAVVLFIFAHFCCNLLATTAFPIFVYGMYSKPLPATDTVTVTRIFLDGTEWSALPILRYGLEDPYTLLATYQHLDENNGIDPAIELKISKYLQNRVTASEIKEVRTGIRKLTLKGLGTFPEWFAKYLRNQTSQPFQTLSVKKETYLVKSAASYKISEQHIMTYSFQ